MKVMEVINVDFSMRHFLLPLMRGIRARGHEVVGVVAEGPLLADIRAEGFRIVPAPLVRRLSLAGQLRACWALVALMRRERPDLVHGHMPISGLLARLAARLAGVPRVAYTCHGFLFNQPAPWPRRVASLLAEWLGGRLTDVLSVTVSQEEAGRRAPARHRPQRGGCGQRARPGVVPPRPCRPPTHPRRTGRGESSAW